MSADPAKLADAERPRDIVLSTRVGGLANPRNGAYSYCLMPPVVSSGAMITCSGALPPIAVPLTATPTGTPVAAGTLVATIQDFTPIANIPPFGMCGLPSNPVVAAATAAKLGVFTPAPCVPAVTAPWAPGASEVMVNDQPALHEACSAACTWGGVITISTAGNPGNVEVS